MRPLTPIAITWDGTEFGAVFDDELSTRTPQGAPPGWFHTCRVCIRRTIASAAPLLITPARNARYAQRR